MIKQLIKIGGAFILRLIFRIFYAFPIDKKRILFVAYEGRQYTCNPKYLFEHIYTKYGNSYEYIWCLNNPKILPSKYSSFVKVVSHYSLMYFYYALTSKFYISNLAIDPILRKRKSQIFVNTWHGSGAYKKVNSNVLLYKKQNHTLMNIAYNWRSLSTSFIISGCQKFTDVMSVDFKISDSKFLPIGLPRNDLFFYSNENIVKKVYDFLKIDNSICLVLYAPTFRGNHRNPDKFSFDLDPKDLQKQLELKYNKKFCVLFRCHKSLSEQIVSLDHTINVSEYPDMQELLYSIEILITDYSSSMWDFSLTNKQCFIYAPDIAEYKSKRDFYTPIEDWPFPIATNHKELINNIITINNSEYLNNIVKHHRELGNFDIGKASTSFCEKIFE